MIPVWRLPEKATPGKAPWVRGICTNARPLWKGPRLIFSGFYGRKTASIALKLVAAARSCQKVRKSPALGNAKRGTPWTSR